jgi:hypothetical protein
MIFITLRNLDRNTDEHINPGLIARLRDVQNRDQERCTVTFSSGDSLTALGSADEILARIRAAYN